MSQRTQTVITWLLLACLVTVCAVYGWHVKSKTGEASRSVPVFAEQLK